jgi:hypothetical protein
MMGPICQLKMDSYTKNRVTAVLVAENIIYELFPLEALQMETTQPCGHIVNAAKFIPKTVFRNSLPYRLLG